MIFKVDKTFQKDVAKISDPKIKSQLFDVLKVLNKTETFSSVNNVKKMSGYKDLYRIRIGNYRIGLVFNETDGLLLIRFLHRKDIYQKWP